MRSKHFRYVASVVLILLALSLAVAAITLVYILLVKPESFFIAFSNLLFLAGISVLTIGAFFEFFLRTSSPQLGRILLMPIEHFYRNAASKETEKEKAEKSEYGPSGGWMLIYAGALAIAVSVLSAFIGMK